MVSDLKATFADIRVNRDARAVIVTGAGRGFCSGANMAGGDDVPESARDRGPVGLVQMFQEHIAELMLAVHELPQPVIAAVHGAAVGGGLALALAATCASRAPTRSSRPTSSASVCHRATWGRATCCRASSARRARPS